MIKIKRLLVIVLSVASLAVYSQNAFHPGKLWLDDKGVHINAHGGGVLYHEGKYYWFGEHKGEKSNNALVGVTCYSSENLYDWKNEGVALAVSEDKHSDIEKGCIIERPKVIYNPKTHQFVMYFHLELKGKGYNAARVGIAVSDRATGGYKFLKSLRPNAGIFPANMTEEQKSWKPNIADYEKWWTPKWYKAVSDGLFVQRDLETGQMSRDMTLYVDDDGKAYHIYSSEDNLTLHIAELSDDFLHYTGKYIRIAPAGHNEAPAIFKKDGKYFMITSGCTGWEPNAARLFSADSIMGEWIEHPNPCTGNDAHLTFHSQSTYILPVQGKKDAFIFMADRWTPKNPMDGRYIWLPIQFENGLPILKWRDQWDMSVFSLLGWAANSVNTVIFRNNSLVSFDNTQFMAYYDEEGFMCLAKRNTGSDSWEINRTKYKGNTNDAHNCISIMADGEGYLHVSWNHHNSPLNYAKSKMPLSLDLEEKQIMTGANENKLTYPAFYRLNNGNLLFLYRDGGSGDGNLVINSYDLKNRQWTRLHDNLISGEGLRNAYWQACIDPNGAIHLSWVWRETPDVATNHDVCYARSTDGGKTWTDSKGKIYTLPLTAQTAEIASKIPQNSELINQTSMTADVDGNPYISTYYRELNSDIPQYHVIYINKNKEWNDISLGFRKTPFSLKGMGTKKIPISRPLIVCSSGENGEKQWRLIFRDEERNNLISMAVCNDLTKNQWTVSDLTDYSVGDWEATFDTELWKNKQLLHLFVQKTLQNDGEKNSQLQSQPVSVLEVTDKVQTIAILKKVNDFWQVNHASETTPFWHIAAYHTGNMAVYALTGDEKYRHYSEAWAKYNHWKGAISDDKTKWKYNYGETPEHVLFGDWQICFQTYIDLYNLDKQKDITKIARAREVMEYEMSTPNNDYWWWADGLYMVMPVMTKLYKATGNQLYLEKLYEYFSFAKNRMYDKEEGLFFRDAKYVYPKHKTPNGKKDFWARGNGWVFAGLAKVLQDLPENDARYSEYVEIFKNFAQSLKVAQLPEGYWTRSLLDAGFAPGYETSGTAFFTYAYLWGVNNGLLERSEYQQTIRKAWNYLTKTALQPDGTVGYVQPIGERADQHVVNERTTADFGVGAFLLAATEMVRFAENKAALHLGR
ncbi:hypothetical protein FACS189413_07960 [Bacteroidia bacterium]|nr:hypothetical protein FACS189413_07960 [Bacteroidia bacterium]